MVVRAGVNDIKPTTLKVLAQIVIAAKVSADATGTVARLHRRS
jgi:hypothetical protein